MTKPLSLLFTTADLGGNVAPVMGVVETLIKRGHSVRVMSDITTKEDVDGAGAPLIPWTRTKIAGRERNEEFGDWAFSDFGDVIEKMLAPWLFGAAIGYAQDMIEEIERERADLLVNFDMLIGPLMGCEAKRQKLALLSTCIAHFPFALPGLPPFGTELGPPRNEAERREQAQLMEQRERQMDAGLPALNAGRAELGLAPLAHVSEQINAVAMRFLGTARAFDFPSAEELPKNVRYVGPLIRDPAWAKPWRSPWPASDPRPLVLVSFSTGFQNHVACLQRVIDACSALPVRALVTLGGSIEESEMRSAPNVAIVKSAPHDVVMREASLVVDHGGHGTVSTTLMHRLPQLVIPHGRDQGDNAVRITERGAGLSLPNTASTEEMRAALSRLLNEPGFKANARRLGDAVAREVEQSTLIGDLEALAAGRKHAPHPALSPHTGGEGEE